MLKIIIGILMLCVVVVSHELGHMLIAKANHIEVKEFWVGVGPQLFSFEKGGTKYCFRIIPLGGACVFENPEEVEPEIGETHEEDDNNCEGSVEPEVIEESEKRLETENSVEGAKALEEKKASFKKKIMFNEASVWARIATLFAGPLFNFILAFVLGLVVVNFSYMPSTKVTSVSDNSPAQQAGIMEGDTIVKINSSKVYLYPEVSLEIQTGVGKPLDVEYKRGNEKYRAQIIPEMNDEYGHYMIGVGFGGDEITEGGFLHVIPDSYKYVRYMVKMTYYSLKMLVNGQASARDMSGAVGIVSVVGDEYEAAAAISPLAVVVSMFNLTVLISANLGVINLLPFPALDGGRLVFAFYEAITGRRVNQNVEGIINFIGMALLLLLLCFTMFNDFAKLFGI